MILRIIIVICGLYGMIHLGRGFVITNHHYHHRNCRHCRHGSFSGTSRNVRSTTSDTERHTRWNIVSSVSSSTLPKTNAVPEVPKKIVDENDIDHNDGDSNHRNQTSQDDSMTSSTTTTATTTTTLSRDRTIHASRVAVSLLATSGSSTSNRRRPRTNSKHPLRMIHAALCQTSRVATAMNHGTVEETIIPSTSVVSSPPLKTSMIKTTIDSVLLQSQQQEQQMNTNQNDDLAFLQPPTLSRPSSDTTATTTVVLDPQTNDVFQTAAVRTTNHPMIHPPKPPMGIVMDHDNNEKDHSTNDRATWPALSNGRNSDVLLYEEHIDREKQLKTVTKVRIATPQDDIDVAYLRMSVFADVQTNTDLIRSQFCTRSCQAIASRRLRGAICLVATTTTTPIPPPSLPQQRSNALSTNCVNEIEEEPHEIVVGSIECSYHEFFHTRLGSCRKQFALLYITEVAVHASVRRRGIGTKLLHAVDRYATQWRPPEQQEVVSYEDTDHHNNIIESLYLHVDVSNYGAIRMYEQCGYYKVWSNDPIYTEFTTGLNLQPGATRGREHYLLCKHLVPHPIWLSNHYDNHYNTISENDTEHSSQSTNTFNDTDRGQPQRHPILSHFGIEIPA